MTSPTASPGPLTLPTFPADGVSALTPRPPAPAAGAVGGGVAMRDFLTDGSVAALCDELARLIGIPIWLRDQSGEVIIPEWTDEGGGEGHPWSMVSDEAGRRRAFALVGLADANDSECWCVPLRIRAGLLGAIVACRPRRDGDASTERDETVRRALSLLASSVADVCEAQFTLRQRVRELDALFRLSSLLSEAGSGGADELLQVALDLAIDVLRADAGSLAVFDDDARVAMPAGDIKRIPLVRASRGLSDDWTSSSVPLSKGGQLRMAALAGEVIAVEDLTTDPRIADHDRVRAEGLCSLLTTGLLDQGRPIGLIRLYTRAPRLFTKAEGELLRAIAEHSATAVATARLRQLRAQDQAVKRQVRLAADVQRRMLPRSVPNMPPFDVAAHYAPSFDLGGDFYDFIKLGGHLGIVVGDVVGKGVPAALLMSAVRASLRAHAQDVYHIDEVLVRVNKALARDTLDNEFATLWYGVADPTTLRLTYCSAGHDWPWLIRVPKDRPIAESDCQRLTADGMALGIDPAQVYPKGTTQLAPGDIVVAYTDGLHDAANFEGKRFGGTRLRRALLELLTAEPAATAARIVDHIVAQVRQHTGLAGRSDDLTLVVLRVGEKK